MILNRNKYHKKNNPNGHIYKFVKTDQHRILSVVKYVNKAVSTLVMVMYEQDYRGTTLSMEAGGYFNFSKVGSIYVKY